MTSMNLCENIKLGDILYMNITYLKKNIYNFNSSIKICIVVKTIQDICAVELFTLWCICPKNFVLSIFTLRHRCYFTKGSFSILHLIIVTATRHFFFGGWGQDKLSKLNRLLRMMQNPK